MKPKIITKNIFVDSRGFFVENFKEQNFSEKFIQDNLSFSSNKGTVRGMHFQTGKSSQTKLVTVLKGKIIDVVMNMETFDVFSFEPRFFLVLVALVVVLVAFFLVVAVAPCRFCYYQPESHQNHHQDHQKQK